MTNNAEFPIGVDFTDVLQRLNDAASEQTDGFIASSGVKLPATAQHMGTVLSYMYRLSCCYWGCDNGDHVMEWLAGRIVNQAVGAHRLIRAANYDEALMLIRGMGEAGNLLSLFHEDISELEAWKVADRSARMNMFGPAAVRKRFETKTGMEPPINKERYQRLCEVGTHPVPGFAPGHYSGTGRPILGGILQAVGIYVCMTEAAYPVAMSAVMLAKLANIPGFAQVAMRTESGLLLRSLGSFTVLNYEEKLAEAMARDTARQDGPLHA